MTEGQRVRFYLIKRTRKPQDALSDLVSLDLRCPASDRQVEAS